ncbi:MAG TPA: RHS repeat-associated core domain-containing protein, partial [Terriglobales bacterium]|nr:RHS repeat-associated core domain-containing protein [Terriglobales bacterium]
IASTGANHYKFNGKERDTESGLDNFGARYYASTMGRWPTPDWSADPTPVPYANMDNPQSLNLYEYALNNPTTLPDLDGHLTPLGACCGDGVGNGTSPVDPEQQQQQLAQQTQGAAAKQLQFTANILGQKIQVTITGGTGKEQVAIRDRLDAAIRDINQHADKLTPSDVKTIHNVKTITIDDTKRTGVDVKSGTYNLRSTYVMAKGSSTAWIASTIAHDAYHVTQYQRGEVYNRQTAARLEHEADQFQLRVGAKFGLTPAELNYIRNDTHTLYNTSPY